MKRIIAAVDFSNSTGDVIKMTKKLGSTYNSKVTVIHTEAPFRDLEYPDSSADGGPRIIDVEDQGEFEKDEANLKSIRLSLKESGIQADYKLLKGDIINSIVKEATDSLADLIITGTHQQGFNISEQLTQKVKCPVMIIPYVG